MVLWSSPVFREQTASCYSDSVTPPETDWQHTGLPHLQEDQISPPFSNRKNALYKRLTRFSSGTLSFTHSNTCWPLLISSLIQTANQRDCWCWCHQVCWYIVLNEGSARLGDTWLLCAVSGVWNISCHFDLFLLQVVEINHHKSSKINRRWSRQTLLRGDVLSWLFILLKHKYALIEDGIITESMLCVGTLTFYL